MAIFTFKYADTFRWIIIAHQAIGITYTVCEVAIAVSVTSIVQQSLKTLLLEERTMYFSS